MLKLCFRLRKGFCIKSSSFHQCRARHSRSLPLSTKTLFNPAQTYLRPITSALIATRGFVNETNAQGEFTYVDQHALDSQFAINDTQLDLANLTTDVSSSLENVANSTSLLQPEVLADYGLGGSLLPHHVVQTMLDFLHAQVGLQWIPTLMVATVVVRMLALPAYVRMRKYNIRANNNMPQQIKMQQEVMAANGFAKKKKAAEYMDFIQKNDLNPLKPLLYQLPTMITFMSFFTGLRGMAQANLPSLTTGGLLWFENLAVSDPFYVLPVLSCVTMHLLLRFGIATTEGGAAMNINWMRNILMWSPFVFLPFFVFQPSAMFVFWMTSNLFTFVQMRVFLQPRVLRFFGIPDMIKHPKSVLDNLQASFSPKAQMENMKKLRDDRKRAEEKVKRHLAELRKFSDEQKRK